MEDDHNTETVNVDWYISTGYVGGTHRGTWTFEPGELPTDLAWREKVLDEFLNIELTNHIDAGYEVQVEQE